MRFLTVRPRWFMYLMIFFIGCSHVWAASLDTQPMQHTAMPKMAVVNAGHHAHVVQAASDTTAIDCHRNSSSQHVSEHGNAPVACHQDDAQKNQHQPSCLDCSPSHCQTLTSVVLQPAFSGIPVAALSRTSSEYWSIQAHNLTGYWQEILRPPRA